MLAQEWNRPQRQYCQRDLLMANLPSAARPHWAGMRKRVRQREQIAPTAGYATGA